MIIKLIILLCFLSYITIQENKNKLKGKIQQDIDILANEIQSENPTNVFKITRNEIQLSKNMAKAYYQRFNEKLKIVCVCTGNTCRSAACEYILRKLYGDWLILSSVGVNARVIGNQMTTSVREILNGYAYPNPTMEIVSNSHQSRNMSDISAQYDILNANIIFAMDTSHKIALLKEFPQLDPAKITVFGIKDPFRDQKTIMQTPVSATYGLNYEMILNLEKKLLKSMIDIFSEALGFDNVLKLYFKNNTGTGKRMKQGKRYTKKRH